MNQQRYVGDELLALAQSGDRPARERMVVENSGLIWSVVRRFFGRGVDADDLYQLGCLGFVKAIDGYDASYGTQFSTYAVPKISGEIRRFLRDDGIIKISRTIKERALLIRRAREKLTQELGRDPYLSELEDETALCAEEIAAAELAVEAPDSLNRTTGDDGYALENTIGTDDMESIVESVALREAISALPERERVLIDLRFFRGLTQDKAARVLGVSQVQVSRLEKKALSLLRTLIA